MAKLLSLLVLCAGPAIRAWPVDEPAKLEIAALNKTRLASLEAEITNLKAESANLKAENADLKAQNADLKAQVEASKNDAEARPSPRGLTFGTGLPAPEVVDKMVEALKALNPLAGSGIALVPSNVATLQALLPVMVEFAGADDATKSQVFSQIPEARVRERLRRLASKTKYLTVTDGEEETAGRVCEGNVEVHDNYEKYEDCAEITGYLTVMDGSKLSFSALTTVGSYIKIRDGSPSFPALTTVGSYIEIKDGSPSFSALKTVGSYIEIRDGSPSFSALTTVGEFIHIKLGSPSFSALTTVGSTIEIEFGSPSFSALTTVGSDISIVDGGSPSFPALTTVNSQIYVMEVECSPSTDGMFPSLQLQGYDCGEARYESGAWRSR